MQSKKYNYLVADDEFPVQKIICDILAIHPNTISIYTANDGEKAFQLYLSNDIDIVITDVLMPRLSGLDLIKKIKETNPEASIIVVSASSNLDIVREALRNGAYDYIIKPFSVDDIMFSINRIIERLKLIEEKKNYLISLEEEIAEVTKRLQSSFFDSLRLIINSLELKDKTMSSHSKNVAKYSEKLALVLNIEQERVENIKIGGFLHDIGKIGIPDNILSKPSFLDLDEFGLIKNHTVLGKKIVEPMINREDDILHFIYYHHERYDGKGYPEGLKGEEIPQVARIAAIANAYDAMTSDRPYKKAKSKKEALVELKANSGLQFDPEMVKRFITLL